MTAVTLYRVLLFTPTSSVLSTASVVPKYLRAAVSLMTTVLGLSRAVLVSPNFLYLVETRSSENETKLNAHQLASRLSFFLWSSPPDVELMKDADQKKLVDPETLKKQVERMLKDSRSEELVRNFTDQWLGLREVGANPPAADLYPQYDRHLEMSMIEEGRALFRTILHEEKNILDFIDPDYVVINERLARYYGLKDVRGDQFQIVPLESGHPRGGILTQTAVLCITSNGTRTSPVKRGTWILKKTWYDKLPQDA